MQLCVINATYFLFTGNPPKTIHVLRPKSHALYFYFQWRSLHEKISYTYWRDGKFYLCFLNQYPDYHTQATSKRELTENLLDLLKDIASREVPFIRKVEELLVA